MTLDEFIAKWDGKGIDFDGAYGFQCVDLAQQYNKDCLGNPPFSGNAVDIWTTYPKDYYEQIVNTPNNKPQKGDIVIWGRGLGQYGHIDVCARDDASTIAFTGYDQNWPLGSVCHVQSHTYFAVLGWLRPKVAVPTPQSPQEGEIMTSDQTNALAVLTTTKQQNGYGNLEATARAGQDAIAKVAELEVTTAAQSGTIGTQNTLISQLQQAKEKLADELSVCQNTQPTQTVPSTPTQTVTVTVPADPMTLSSSVLLDALLKKILIKLHVSEGR